jgi:hypothetical protein
MCVRVLCKQYSQYIRERAYTTCVRGFSTQYSRYWNLFQHFLIYTTVYKIEFALLENCANARAFVSVLFLRRLQISRNVDVENYNLRRSRWKWSTAPRDCWLRTVLYGTVPLHYSIIPFDDATLRWSYTVYRSFRTIGNGEVLNVTPSSAPKGVLQLYSLCAKLSSSRSRYSRFFQNYRVLLTTVVVDATGDEGWFASLRPVRILRSICTRK